ncbi:unnamed protein product [Cercospora beticola]|nr:unnamed protein product [Cercospora beticola]
MSSDTHPALDDPNYFVFYRYHPSLAAAIIFAIVFSITVGLHVVQCIRSRTWYLIPFLIGGFCEIVGYIGRAISSQDQWALGPYIMQTMTLLIAPAFCAASIYMTLGRIILATNGERFSIVRKQWLTKIFVTGDVIAIIGQGAGGGIMSSGTLSAMKTGEKIVVAGLFMQIFFFGFFMVASSTFYWRMNKVSTTSSYNTGPPWKRHCWALLGVSLAIFVRSVFRVIEYLQGNNGYLLRYEVYLYVFDACLMLFVFALYNGIHPSEITSSIADSHKHGHHLLNRQSV